MSLKRDIVRFYLEYCKKFINFVEIYRYMARPLHRVIAELREKIELLATQRDAARAAQASAAKEAEELRIQLEDCRGQLRQARLEVDFLTVSHRLADSPENIISARRRLQRLIAKIDRCVSLLKEDAEIS